MIRFNLLPHREHQQRRREQQYRQQLVILFTSACALVLALLLVLHARQAEQAALNQILRNAQDHLAQKIGHMEQLQDAIQGLKQQLEQIEQLQRQRNATVLLLGQLARQTPSGIVLRQLSQDPAQLWLDGDADSHQAIVEMLDRLRHSSTIGSAQLGHTTQNGQRHAFRIIVQAPWIRQEPAS